MDLSLLDVFALEENYYHLSIKELGAMVRRSRDLLQQLAPLGFQSGLFFQYIAMCVACLVMASK